MTNSGAQPEQRRALLLVNPRARRGAQWADLAHQQLSAAGYSLITPHEDDERSYSELILAHQHQVDVVIVGGGMTIEKDAAPDDGRLDAYSLEVRHWWQILALFPSLRRGTHGRWGSVRTLSGTQFSLHTRRPHDINADGEIIGRTPAHYRLIERAIAVLAPDRP